MVIKVEMLKKLEVKLYAFCKSPFCCFPSEKKVRNENNQFSNWNFFLSLKMHLVSVFFACRIIGGLYNANVGWRSGYIPIIAGSNPYVGHSFYKILKTG